MKMKMNLIMTETMKLALKVTETVEVNLRATVTSSGCDSQRKMGNDTFSDRDFAVTLTVTLTVNVTITILGTGKVR